MSHIQARLNIFRNNKLCWYLASCLLVSFGNGLAFIATTWLTLQQGNGLGSVALLMICMWLPNVLLSPVFGVIADRYNRKHLLVIADGVKALFFFGFWLLMQYQINNMLIYLFTIVSSITFALYLPTSMAFIREIVEEKELLYANSTVDIMFEVGFLAGAGLTGLVIALTSIQTTILLGSLLFLAATLCLFFIRYQYKSAAASQLSILMTFYQDFKAGAKYLLQDKDLLSVYNIQLLLYINFMTAPVLLAPFAKNVLSANVGQFGDIEAALSAGAILGGLLGPYFADKFGLKKVLLVETALLALSFYLFKNSHSLLLADGLYLLIGLCYSSWPLIMTQAQTMTKLSHQGRVQSLFTSLAGIAILLAYLLVYGFSDVIGLRQFYWLEVITPLLAGLLLLRSSFSKTTA